MLVNEHIVDCIWSDFGPWSKCTKTCGFGTQKRKRFFAVAAIGDGKPCLGAPSEERSCNQKACITTTTRRTTTSTTLKSTDIDTSGTTTFSPPQTTISFTENDLNPDIETTTLRIIHSTQHTSPPEPQINENAPILEASTSRENSFSVNIETNTNLETKDSIEIPTSTDSTKANQSNNSTIEQTTNISSPPLENSTSDTLSSKNASSIIPSFDKKKNVMIDNKKLDTIETQNRTILDNVETVEENEIQDVPLESPAKAFTNADAFNDLNAKQLEKEISLTSSVQLSSIPENNLSSSNELSKGDVISNASPEVSNVVSVTNDLISNSNELQNHHATNSIDVHGDEMEKKGISLNETEMENLLISQDVGETSPSVSLNGVGDVDSE